MATAKAGRKEGDVSQANEKCHHHDTSETSNVPLALRELCRKYVPPEPSRTNSGLRLSAKARLASWTSDRSGLGAKSITEEEMVTSLCEAALDRDANAEKEAERDEDRPLISSSKVSLDR